MEALTMTDIVGDGFHRWSYCISRIPREGRRIMPL